MARDARKKRYCSLAHAIEALNRGAFVKFEYRPTRYLFSATNYGEMVGDVFYNAADGDRWDVWTPACARKFRVGTPYRVRRVVGYVRAQDGNHKLAVQMWNEPFDADACAEHGARYARLYTKATGVRCTYVPFVQARRREKSGCGCG